MATELQYQSYLTKAADELGGYGFKLANRFLVGIPDLFIQIPERPTLVIEIKKWTKLPKAPTLEIDNGLTGIQRSTLLSLLKAGTKGGWIALYREGTTDYLFASADPYHNPSRSEFNEFAVIRKRGTPWTSVLLPSLAPLWGNTQANY